MKLILDPISVVIDKAIEKAECNNRTVLRIELTKAEYDELLDEFHGVAYFLSPHIPGDANISRYRNIPVVKV